MTDLDLLTGALAARVRLLEGVARLYPSRSGLDGLVRSAAALLDAVADDPAVAVRLVDGALLVEASVGLDDDSPAPATAARVAAEIRATCAQSDVAVHRVRVRIASIG